MIGHMLRRGTGSDTVNGHGNGNGKRACSQRILLGGRTGTVPEPEVGLLRLTDCRGACSPKKRSTGVSISGKPWRFMGIADGGIHLAEAPASLTHASVSLVDAMMSLTDAIMSLRDASTSVTDAIMSLTDAPMSVTDAIMSLTDASTSVTDAIMGLKYVL